MLLTYVICFFMNSTPTFAAEGGGKSSSNEGGAGIGLTVNFPHILDLSYETLNRASHLTYAFSAGYIPPVTISVASVSLLSLDARARWHPFGGAFFFGIAAGYQSVSASGSETLNESGLMVPITVKDTLGNIYATPHLGWLWLFGKLMIGLEAGMQMGFGASNTPVLTINDPTMQAVLAQVEADPSYTQFQNKISTDLNKLGNMSLPYIGFKLGWKL